MAYRVVVLAAACAALGACSHVVATSPPRQVRRIVVLPVDDRTGSTLYVDAPPLLALLGGEPPRRVTVPELLAAELREQLAARGFEVLDDAHAGRAPSPAQSPEGALRLLRESGVDAAVLYTRLSRWDPLAPSHVSYVDVAAETWMLVATREAPLWRAALPATPVPAGSASSITLAYPIVARRVVERLIASLAPVPIASPPPEEGERKAKSS